MAIRIEVTAVRPSGKRGIFGRRIWDVNTTTTYNTDNRPSETVPDPNDRKVRAWKEKGARRKADRFYRRVERIANNTRRDHFEW